MVHTIVRPELAIFRTPFIMILAERASKPDVGSSYNDGVKEVFYKIQNLTYQKQNTRLSS